MDGLAEPVAAHAVAGPRGLAHPTPMVLAAGAGAHHVHATT